MITAAFFIESEKENLLSWTENLHNALNHLRYEGKLLKEENIKAVQILAYGLDDALEKHCQIQEEIIFPFLQTHIPRHEAAIALLEAEHEDIKNQQEKLKNDILKISGMPNHLEEGKIYEAGIYLVTLLRHHIGFEKRNLQRSLQTELRDDEKAAIHKQIEDWLQRKLREKNRGAFNETKDLK